VLDTTIANVALPHMQADLSASQDQINWVLTSYIVASAVALPISGWLADRVGRKRLLLISVVLAGIGARRLAKGRGADWLTRSATVLVLVVLAAYLVALWAMTAKPD